MKLDKKKLGKYANKILTTQVVLTEERRKHIFENHTNDYKEILKNIRNGILNPHEIIEDIKNVDTLFYISKLEKNNLNIVIKLNTKMDEKHPKNSIMTAWIIRNKNLEKLRKKNKIIYRKE